LSAKDQLLEWHAIEGKKAVFAQKLIRMKEE
jgi:hypothetical protein